MEEIPAKTIVTKSKDTRWFGTHYNMNIYRGCSHGCIYCDSRSDCYQIDHFDQVRPKKNALEIIRNDLRRKVRSGVVATGGMSDPYNPLERELELTRHSLELLWAYEFGVAICTKSDLILRDLDLLKELKAQSPVLCQVTVTTADDSLAAHIEPHVSRPSQRLEAIARLRQEGLFAGIMLMPVLPFLEDRDENIIQLVRQAHDCGARYIYPAFGVTLRGRQREWFYRCLDESFPGVRQQYEQRFGDRYFCPSPRAKSLFSLFTRLCEQYGILYKMEDIVAGYQGGYAPAQLSFFSH